MKVVTRVRVGGPCRVRMYRNNYALISDATRSTTEAPAPGHGLIMDLNLTPNEGRVWNLFPQALYDETEPVVILVEPPKAVMISTSEV